MIEDNDMIFDDFKVNIHDLHNEWKRVPSTSFTFESKLARAKADSKETKRALDLALADAMNSVVDSPEDYGISKGQLNSSTFVRNRALNDPAYQEAFQKWIEAEKESDWWQGAVYSMINVRITLDNVTKLFLAGYYSSDTTIPDARVEAINRQEFEQQQRKALKHNLRLRRTKDDIKDEKP